MKVGNLIRHKDDRHDQYYVVIEIVFGRFKIRHTQSGWETWPNVSAHWEVVCESRHTV